MSLTHSLRLSENPSRKRPYRIGARRKKYVPFVQTISQEQPDLEKRTLLINGAKTVGVLVVISGVSVAIANALLPAGGVSQVLLAARSSPYAAVIYGAAAIVLPTLFVSQTLMTLSAGALFGPVTGTIISITAQTFSAMIAYGIGTQLARRTQIGSSLIKRIDPYIGRLRRNPFEGMVLMRLIYLPHEAVSYATGMLEVGWQPLILGTALGSLPSTLFLVQIGAAISAGVLGSVTYFNPALLVVSGGVLVGSVVVAKYMRQEEIDDLVDIVEGEIVAEKRLIE